MQRPAAFCFQPFAASRTAFIAPRAPIAFILIFTPALLPDIDEVRRPLLRLDASSCGRPTNEGRHAAGRHHRGAPECGYASVALVLSALSRLCPRAHRPSCPCSTRLHPMIRHCPQPFVPPPTRSRSPVRRSLCAPPVNQSKGASSTASSSLSARLVAIRIPDTFTSLDKTDRIDVVLTSRAQIQSA